MCGTADDVESAGAMELLLKTAVLVFVKDRRVVLLFVA
jgi:hypothetical protein